ncbi:MAG: tetratricopeptide repeat protein [Candidatus Acidiferrales bacterium]
MQTLQAAVSAALQNMTCRFQTLTRAVLLAVVALAVGAQPLLALRSQNQDQDQNNDQTQKPAPRDKGVDPRSNPPPPASSQPVTPKPPDDPGKVAYLAQKDIEVGTFYLHKGDTAAAIDRFHHAAETRPTLSKPWELLGEAYEKMDDKQEALKSYQQYLKIQPGAADAKKVQKKIAKLQSDLN